MKKLICAAMGLLLTVAANAQTPENKAISLVYKITATWCGPCGTFGWNVAEALRASTKDKSLYWALYASSACDLYSPTAAAIANAITFIGYPSFGINNIEGGEAQIESTSNTFATSSPVASPAADFSIAKVGTNTVYTVTVSAKAKFWTATTGEYYMGAYIVEDEVMNSQVGKTGDVAHHDVLRASMSSASAWGEQLVNGAVTANNTYSKSYSFLCTNTLWNTSKLKVYMVIWKKEGATYKFVNAALAKPGSTGIDDLLGNSGLTVFPNPAHHSLNVRFDALKSADVSYSVIDIAGRQALPAVTTTLKQGTNQQSIATHTLTPGLYYLTIRTGSGSVQKTFVKQ